MTQEPETITVTEAARILGVNRETIRRWVDKGAISYVELGPHKRRKLRRADVLKQKRDVNVA